MGEYADLYIDSMIDGWHNFKPRVSQGPRPVKCKFCGKAGLKWTQINGPWELLDGTSIHNCSTKF